ncbi:uncharacterized protein LOC109810625 [Cajanus cajan]|uniref:uncharacterized protein LOC109810625 n=1 Tax=Cajanus cajan TaxID=3821 RepID=UPI0010FBBA64|nr:uncharacterized protein LOC109810625 [Cajanus cajan]
MSRRGIDYVPDSDEEVDIVPSNEEPLSPLSPPTPKLGDDDEETSSTCDIGRVIPGPAGLVQATMRNRESENPLPTQQFLADLNGPAMLVFNSNPWRYAMHYVKSRGLPEVTTLINIDHNLQRVPTVVAFVESMTPTGQGNYTINLKVWLVNLLYIKRNCFVINCKYLFQDPTAAIGANLHYKVKQHRQYGKDIVVGCVLILKQVVMFAPRRFRGPYLLNITKNNVKRVIPKDI